MIYATSCQIMMLGAGLFGAGFGIAFGAMLLYLAPKRPQRW